MNPIVVDVVRSLASAYRDRIINFGNDEIGSSIDEINRDLQLGGRVTRSRAKKLQGYLQCYLHNKLEDDGVEFRQYKLVSLLYVEDEDLDVHQD